MLTEVKHQNEGVRFLSAFANGETAPPLLLVGPEGVGKRFSVLQAAKGAFCMADRQEGCECPSCKALEQGNHPDYVVLSGAIGVDEIRDLTQQARQYPIYADSRCFVLDGVDIMTIPAANAFLKLLEEPPKTTNFFLLANSQFKVLPTIQSRCGLVRYAPLPNDFLVSKLKQYEEDQTKAEVYAGMADGSLGAAMRYWGAGKLSFRDMVIKTLKSALIQDLPVLFSDVDGLGKEIPLALRYLEQLVHDVLIFRLQPNRVIHKDRMSDLETLAEGASAETWTRLADSMRILYGQQQTTRLNLAFQMKTNLVEAFI